LDYWSDIERQISGVTGKTFHVERRDAVSGGCINAAWRVEGDRTRYFVKTNKADVAPRFALEADGLRTLLGADAIRVPRVICLGADAEASWIVLEYLELQRRDARCDAALGAKLAALHRVTRKRYGGLDENTPDRTPRPNALFDDWPAFWRDCRLGFQLSRARVNGYTGALQTKGEALLERVPQLLHGREPVGSLLHGDLWAGNAAADERGAPVIYDPAVYYGDRETDIAMTELFGGFSQSFYAAYRDAYPLDAGYDVRKTLYNLYHVLNHVNRFGGGYLRQAESMIGALLAHVA
jgi:fructosamine-3-kinase